MVGGEEVEALERNVSVGMGAVGIVCGRSEG